MDRKPATTPDERLARLAARQHGVVSLAQLEATGIKADAARQRVRAGRLVRIHRAVYAVGHGGLSPQGRWMAAVLACDVGGGSGCVLSHRSAAELWTLLPPTDGVPHVTLPGISGRDKRRGIRLHRSRALTPADCTRRLNIPVTTPTRTLLDLSRIGSAPELATARRQAEFLGLPLDEKRLDGPRERSESPRSRTDLERDFLRLCRRHRLPEPEVNVPIDRYQVDFLWRGERLVLETDGWAAHRGRMAFEEDRRRATVLATLGFEVMRVTWRQVKDEAAEVAAAVRARLRARRQELR
jgi:very-short-patch-repair endonuclease